MGKKEDLMKKGLIQDRKEKSERLEIKIDSLVKSINTELFIYDGIESIEIKAAQQNMDELAKTIADWEQVKKELKELE